MGYYSFLVFLLAFLLITISLMSSNTVMVGARHPLEESSPKKEELETPKPVLLAIPFPKVESHLEIPTFPKLDKPEVPKLPKPEFPKVPEYPKLELPKALEHPKPELPKKPDYPKPEQPKVPKYPMHEMPKYLKPEEPELSKQLEVPKELELPKLEQSEWP